MPSLPIESAAIHQGGIKTNLRFSYGKASCFPFTLIELRSKKCTGIGEGLVNSWELFEKSVNDIMGKDAVSLDKILPSYLNEKKHNIEREAISIALYSLVSTAYGIPLYVLLGGKKRNNVPLMPCIFPESPGDAEKKAEKFFRMGFRFFKVKFIGDVKEDLGILRAVRKSISDNSYLQADVNCGYKDTERFGSVFKKFSDSGLNVIEDPVKGSLSDYRHLRNKTNVKIMIDEKARSLKDVGKVLKYSSADIINQHPCQQGGLENALKISAAAEAFGVPTMVGGTGFLGVGTAAHQILASVIGLSFPCGELGGYVDHGFEMGLVKKPLPIKDGCAHIPDTTGLGVEIDRKKLAKLTEKRCDFKK